MNSFQDSGYSRLSDSTSSYSYPSGLNPSQSKSAALPPPPSHPSLPTSSTSAAPASNSQSQAPKASLAQSYRSFLAPARHGRFLRSAGWAFLGCYIANFLMSKKSLGTFLPFGAVPLLFSVLAIFMVRISRCHIGRRTARSRISELIPVFFSFNAVTSLFWFGLSTWLYAQIYMKHAQTSGAFYWVETGRPYERPWLNERPIIMGTVFFMIGIFKGIRHLYFDLDRIPFPARKFLKGKPVPIGTPSQRIKGGLRSELQQSVLWSLRLVLLSVILYFLFFRQISWKIAFTLLHKFLGLPRAYRPGRLRAPWSLVLQHCTLQAVICGLMQDFASLCFTAYLTQPPFRNSKFLTDDALRPNQTLVLGLKSGKELQRNSAFYELATIAHTVGPRRVSIFKELADKHQPTSTWATISTICLQNITSISQRINFARVQGDAPALDSAPPTPIDPDFDEPKTKIVSPLKADNIIQPVRRHGKLDAAVEGVKAFYSVPSSNRADAALSSFSSSVMQTVRDSGHKIIAEIPQQPVVKSAYQKAVEAISIILSSSFGTFFIQLPSRLVATTVCTSPLSESGIITDSIDALTQLCIASLKEDRYGRVFSTIPNVIRTIATVLVDLDTFIADVIPDSTLDRPESSAFSSSVFGTSTTARPKLSDTHKLSPYYQSPRFTKAVLSDPLLSDVFAVRSCLRQNLYFLLVKFTPHRDVLRIPEQEWKDLRRLVESSERGSQDVPSDPRSPAAGLDAQAV